MTGRRDTSQAGLEPSVPPRDETRGTRGGAPRFPGRAGRKARGGEEEGAFFPGKRAAAYQGHRKRCFFCF